MTRFNISTWLAFALLVGLGTGRWALAPAAWLAPIFGLLLMHRHGALRGCGLVFAALALATGIAWYGAVPLPLPLYVGFMLLNGLIATLPYLADRLLVPRLRTAGPGRGLFGSGFGTTLVFPLAATAVEYLTLSDGPLGSFGAQAYGQIAIAPLAQLASLGGLWIITFVVSWFAAVALWAGSRYRARAPFGGGVAVYGAVVLLVAAWGTGRLLGAPPAATHVDVAAFTATRVDMPAMMQLLSADPAAFRTRTREQHAVYLERTAEAARTGARIVLWPELAGLGLADDVATLVGRGRQLAHEYEVYLAMPLLSIDPAGRSAPVNRIVVAGPDGQIVLDHIKYGGNLLEGTAAGNREIATVQTPYGVLAAVICWDTDYPGVVRQAGRQGVDLLLSPARVWPEVAAIHVDMAAFRAIENGMTVLRHSDNGVSAVIDPYGRFMAREDFGGQDNTQLRVAVPISTVRTWYPAVGDLVGQVSVAGLVLLVVLVLVRRKRSAFIRIHAATDSRASESGASGSRA